MLLPLSNTAAVLAGLALDYEKLPPIKEGKCGTPAPILLKAVGNDPKVEINALRKLIGVSGGRLGVEKRKLPGRRR